MAITAICQNKGILTVCTNSLLSTHINEIFLVLISWGSLTCKNDHGFKILIFGQVFKLNRIEIHSEKSQIVLRFLIFAKPP